MRAVRGFAAVAVSVNASATPRCESTSLPVVDVITEPYVGGRRSARHSTASMLPRFVRASLSWVSSTFSNVVLTGKVDYNTLEAAFLIAAVCVLLAGTDCCVGDGVRRTVNASE